MSACASFVCFFMFGFEIFTSLELLEGSRILRGGKVFIVRKHKMIVRL